MTGFIGRVKSGVLGVILQACFIEILKFRKTRTDGPFCQLCDLIHVCFPAYIDVRLHVCVCANTSFSVL